MPTYEYECKTCSHKFEIFQSISEDPIKICPECGKEVRKIIGGGLGIIFKGSGFYVTDNRKGSASEAPKKSEGDSSEKKDTAKTSDSSGGSSSGDSSSGDSGKSKEPAKEK